MPYRRLTVRRAFRLLLAAALLLIAAAPAARAAMPKTINFDDRTGDVGDSYYTFGSLSGVRFLDTGGGFNREASAYATSAPNVATIPFFPAPRSRPRHARDVPLGNSEGDVEFQFSRGSVAMSVLRPNAIDAGAFTIKAFTPGGTLVATNSVTIPANSTAAVPISVTSFSSDIQTLELQGTGGGWAIDDFTFDVPDTPPPPDFGLAWPGRSALQVPIGNGDTVDVPLALTRVNASSGPITLSASNVPSGVTATFLPNPATDTALHSQVTMRLHASSIASLAAVARQPVTVTATPSASAGAASRQVIVPVTVLAEFDLRARGMEITQGIQSGGPNDGLPQVVTGPRTYSYRGVRLVAYGYKPTIVRFFADASGAPRGGADAAASLEGFRNGKPLPDSPLHPDGGGGVLIDRGPGERVTYAERSDDTHPFNFTIPPGWQSGTITLKAHVEVPPSFAFGQTERECGLPFCVTDNATTLTDVNFTQEAVVSADPIKVAYTDRTQTNKGYVEPGDWYEPFRLANQVDPITILPHYWGGTIDVTTHKVFKGFKGWVTRSFISDDGIDRNDKSSEVLDDLDDLADDHPGISWPIGLIDDFPQYDGSTSDLGSSHGGPLNDDRPTAVVNPSRPLGSVAHEIGHNLGRQHASGGCGGADGDQTAEDWPDPYGYTEAVGVDFTQPASDGGQYRIIAGDIGSPGGVCLTDDPNNCGGANPPQPFDYMSYCASEGSAWISAIGWQEILDRYNLGVTRARARATTATVEARRPGVKVRGFITATGAQIVDVERGRFARTRASSASTLRLEATNAKGKAIASAPLHVLSGHTDNPGRPAPALNFEGTVPAGAAASVRIMREGKQIARRDRSAHAPKVRFLSPKAKQVVGRKKTVPVRWKAHDRDKTPVEVSLDYSSNGGRTYRRIYMGPNRGHVALPRQYFSHARRARLRLTADDGFNQTGVQSKVFRSLGAPPVVRIAQPVKGTVKAQNAPLLLSGFAFDDADKRLRHKALTWSFGGRVVGHGENIAPVGLLAGRHRLTLTAKDSSGRKARKSVVVRLTPVQPAFRRVTAPKKVSRKARHVTLRIASTVDTPLKVGKRQRFTARTGLTRVRVKIKRGRSKLTLRLVLGSGKLVARRTVTIARS